MRVKAGPVACVRVGTVMVSLVSGVLLDERDGRVEVVGGLDADARDALESATGESDEGAGRRELDDSGDTGAASDSMVRSQRTGEATWSTSSSRNLAPDSTREPSWLVQIGRVGSEVA